MMKSLTLYYVIDIDVWAWSPDGEGCYWYDTENEARADSLEPLKNGGAFDTDQEFEEFRKERI